MANADIYKKIFEAKTTQGGTPIRDGEYLFAVEKLILENKYSGMIFVAELQVMECRPVDVDPKFMTEAERGVTLTPSAVGSKVSFVINLTTNHESGPGNVKSFMLALDGTPEDKISEDEFIEMLKKATGPDQPFRGALVRDRTWRKLIQKGKNAGKPFTAHKWDYVEQTVDEIRSRRATLDSAGK